MQRDVSSSRLPYLATEKVTIEGQRFVIQRERVRTPSERLELELVRREFVKERDNLAGDGTPL
jgi:hypothetical protein